MFSIGVPLVVFLEENFIDDSLKKISRGNMSTKNT